MEEWGLRAGDEVELKGLSKVELNGQRGTILPLEYPEQAKMLGRLAVVLQASGKQLSLKVENLVKVAPPKLIKTGGDRGEEWSALLRDRGKSMGLPLQRDFGPRGAAMEAAKRDLVLLTLNLSHLAGLPQGEQLTAARLREIAAVSPSPDLVCVQEGLEGSDLLSQAGYTKLISSAVKAQTVREMAYFDMDALQELPREARDKLLVNELYINSQGTQWEVADSGVEQTSSDIELTEGDMGVSGPLAVRSLVWVRLRPRISPEGPFVFVLNTQLTGGQAEDQFFLGQLAGERRRQLQRIVEVFESRATEGDLGVIVGDFDAPGQEDALGDALSSYFQASVVRSARVKADAAAAKIRGRRLLEKGFLEHKAAPFALLRERGWTLAYDQATLGATSHLGFLADHVATSREVPVAAERMAFASGGGSSSAEASGRHGVKAVLTVRHKSMEPAGEQRLGLIELPIIGYGTCFMPEDMKDRVSDKEYRRMVDEMTAECVQKALECGVRLFECANRYMNQQTVGRTIEEAIQEGLVTRSELFICGRIQHCKDKAEVKREVDLMLRELRVSYVDLLTMDVPPERAPKAWAWLEEVYREGKTRYLGVSNFDLLGPKVCTEVFREFLSKVEIPPSVFSMEVHPFNTNEEMSECCRGLEIQVMAYSPLGAGHKVEAFLKTLTRSDARDMRPMLKVADNPVLLEVGRRHGASASQVALRWNLQRGHCVVPKSFDPAHIAENTELFHFGFSEQEVGILSSMNKGMRADRFFHQAHSTGKKVVPQMSRDAQDACRAVLEKIRGLPNEEEKRQGDLLEMLQQQQAQQAALKGKGKGGYPAPEALGGKGPPQHLKGAAPGGKGGPAMLSQGGKGGEE
mmetsp:Transcript_56407/g.175397  ORF Transcript_56407/g.175397 Transcript_56407/m.175397 type:complete len:861 (+) Transcript_56407:87-2669(+)